MCSIIMQLVFGDGVAWFVGHRRQNYTCLRDVDLRVWWDGGISWPQMCTTIKLTRSSGCSFEGKH